MGVKKGLSIDGLTYLADVAQGNTKPDWMNITKEVAKMTGHYKILNMMTGYKNLQSFFVRSSYSIGGMYFDGIIRTEHASRIRPTQYPVQTGVTMTDHALIEPAELTIEVMMTDTSNNQFHSTDTILNLIYQSNNWLRNAYSGLFGGLPCSPPAATGTGDGRSVDAWKALKAMQLSRVPLVVETRLGTYNNMIIEELSAPDDVKTLHALKATVRMREIIVADVAESKTSTRKASATATSSGQTPVSTAPDKTAAKAGVDAIKGALS